MRSDLSAADIRCVLLDIEGTVTPIAFVHEVLFPYARSRVKDFLVSNLENAEVKADVAKLCEEHAVDCAQQHDPPLLYEGPIEAKVDSLTTYVHWLIDRDRKSTGLKSLQGKIWKEGYLDGSLKATLFDDVAPAMKRWRDAGLRINIFSSGSVLAQQLLFAHTNAGDLTNLIDNYFDTTVGPKAAEESYRKIAASLNVSTGAVLFISDVLGELNAAAIAGLPTLLCERPGNQPQPDHSHRVIETFDGLLLT